MIGIAGAVGASDSGMRHQSQLLSYQRQRQATTTSSECGMPMPIPLLRIRMATTVIKLRPEGRRPWPPAFRAATLRERLAPTSFFEAYSNVPPHFQPSEGRVMFTILRRGSAGLRPGFPTITTSSPGFKVSRVPPYRPYWPRRPIRWPRSAFRPYRPELRRERTSVDSDTECGFRYRVWIPIQKLHQFSMHSHLLVLEVRGCERMVGVSTHADQGYGGRK